MTAMQLSKEEATELLRNGYGLSQDTNSSTIITDNPIIISPLWPVSVLQRSLNLVITKKCIADCDICCFSCSPHNEDKMPFGDSLNYINQASEAAQFTSVGISDGEPFIYFNDLVDILKCCKSHALNFSCSTNSFWADTIENSRLYLKTLTDIGHVTLSLSFDEFHSKYIPYENIRNVLIAAKEFPNLFLSCWVVFVLKRVKN